MKALFTEHWDNYLQFFPKERKDIYFEENYVKLYEDKQNVAICFVASEDRNYAIYPFLRRKFEYNGTTYYDFETPYGYGGPICNVDDDDFFKRSLLSFKEYCRKNNYVAGFTRFHPLLKNWTCFDTIGSLIYDRKTIAIDIKGNIDDVWMNEIHTKNRNVIKKGFKNNLKFIADYDYKYLPQFVSLYNKTMDKLEADDFYYFDDQYYESFINNIENSFLGVVEYEGSIISSAIFFYSDCYAHYHLAGSNLEYLKLSPNNFLLWNAAVELNKKGIGLFHLGGGINSDEHNSLFEFKCKFSKSRYQFVIGKLIFNEPVYDALCKEWELSNPGLMEKYKHHLLKYKY